VTLDDVLPAKNTKIRNTVAEGPPSIEKETRSQLNNYKENEPLISSAIFSQVEIKD
jgi:hypothetical protein